MILNHSRNFEGTCAIIILVVGVGRINPMIFTPYDKQLRMCIYIYVYLYTELMLCVVFSVEGCCGFSFQVLSCTSLCLIQLSRGALWI